MGRPRAVVFGGASGLRDMNAAARSTSYIFAHRRDRLSLSPPDRVAGRILSGWDRRTAALCTSSARDGERARWGQYRAIWDYVERAQCRRAALLVHFGDRSTPAPVVECCDHCAPSLVPPAPVLTRAACAPARKCPLRWAAHCWRRTRRDRRDRRLGPPPGRANARGRDPPRPFEGDRRASLRRPAGLRELRASALR